MDTQNNNIIWLFQMDTQNNNNIPTFQHIATCNMYNKNGNVFLTTHCQTKIYKKVLRIGLYMNLQVND